MYVIIIFCHSSSPSTLARFLPYNFVYVKQLKLRQRLRQHFICTVSDEASNVVGQGVSSDSSLDDKDVHLP